MTAQSSAKTGVAPDARLLAYKLLNERGRGTTSGVIAGIERALDPNGDGDTSLSASHGRDRSHSAASSC